MSLIENLNKSRKELLDLGLRNSLINHRKRAKQIRVYDEISSEIFRILVRENKTMNFLALKEGDKRFETAEDTVSENGNSGFELMLADDNSNDGLGKQHLDNKLQTGLDQQQLQKKLLSIHRDAKTYIEEQGVNILYLALGFLHWYESDSSKEIRRAPLILIPVELKRSNVKERFQIQYSGSEISDNLSLQEKLKLEFDIKLPSLDDAEELDINDYFKKASKSIKNIDRWTIDPNEMTLGFFSFGKFLMYADLNEKAWPKGKRPENNEILTALLTDGFETKPSQYKNDTNIDKIVSPGDLHLVMDADSSQITSMLEINDGRNLVIQGPPGTGKSQTITNIIAEAIGQGKKILFVSEKMAALEVVKRRLDMVHLGDCALELHSYKTNKKTLLDEIERTLNLGKPQEAVREGDMRLLTKYRDQLNAYTNAVNHSVGKTNTSFITAIGKAQQIKFDYPKPKRFDFSHMEDWDLSKFKDARILVEKLDRQIERIGKPINNPFYGSTITDFLPDDKFEVIELLDDSMEKYEDLIKKSQAIQDYFENLEIKQISDIQKLINTSKTINDAPDTLSHLNLLSPIWNKKVIPYFEAKKYLFELSLEYQHEWKVDEFLQADLSDLNKRINKVKEKWWKLVSIDYYKAKKEVSKYYKRSKLPKNNDEIMRILDAFTKGQEYLMSLRKTDQYFTSLLKSDLDYINWSDINIAAEWFIHHMKREKEGLVLNTLPQYLSKNPKINIDNKELDLLESVLNNYLDSLNKISEKLMFQGETHNTDRELKTLDLSTHKEKFINWKTNIDEISEWVRYNQINAEMRNEGLSFIVDETNEWTTDFGFLSSSFDFSWFYGIAGKAYKDFPEIKSFNKSDHEMVKQKYMDLDKELFTYNQFRLASSHFEKIPHLGNGGGQLRIIQKELHKKRRHMPIRELIKSTGQVLQELKPVFMMSPMSIATYIPPGTLEFDLVVFDEASQVKPVDAFGALLRGKQGVVVGDDKQLPPTSFFDSRTGDYEEDDYDSISDIESILSLFLAKGANEKMLRWHYRSRHDSLIAVSNSEFYNNKLFIFPSSGINPEAEGLSIKYLPETSYDRGNTRTNQEEAEAVARVVMQHAQETPNLSLGVVAFSVAQRDAIIFHLENLRQQNKENEHFFTETSVDGELKEEPFFVKNLENVQGDERDVILISIGYGKTKEGYFPMSFGPLNRDGGERRLNVLISRAKKNMQVFTNFKSSDINLERANGRGVTALKNFLAYAETGIIDKPYKTGKEPDSPFEEAVLKRLKLNNIDAVPQVGTAGFFIDIGITNPNNRSEYILGVECDGASYHSSRSARDRDRLRQEVLEGLGWRIYRIWSTDWFKNPEIELSRLIQEIEKAKSLAGRSNSNERNEKNNNSRKLTREENGKQDSAVTEMEKAFYKKSDLSINTGYHELHEINDTEMSEWVKRIVNDESPIHKAHLISRITESAGYSKAGNRIKNAIENGINRASNMGYLKQKGDFLWSQNEKVIPRDRSNLINGEKNVDFIAPEEIQAALIIQVKNGFSISPAEARVLVANMLGFTRVTEKTQNKITKQINLLVKNQAFKLEENLLLLNHI